MKRSVFIFWLISAFTVFPLMIGFSTYSLIKGTSVDIYNNLIPSSLCLLVGGVGFIACVILLIRDIRERKRKD